jgi:hypothetical protein
MVYLATFILALLLTHITLALPRLRRDPASPPPYPLRVTYDNTFDNPQGSLNNVACSNGDNGLASTFPTFGDLPTFPYIGGAFDIAWNSPYCGGCWQIYNPANGAWVFITAVDTAGAGFNLAEEAYRALNGGVLDGATLDVEALNIDPINCGI